MATTAIPEGTKWWAGGRSPFNLSYGKAMMWYFLLSDAFTFGAFLISYGTTRLSVNYWPDPNHVYNAVPFMGHANLPLVFVSIMTFILIASSVTMVLAVHEGHHMNKKGVEKYMILTIIGGLMFLGCQAWEWTHLLTGQNISLLNDGTLGLIPTKTSINPWGLPLEGAEITKALAATSHESLLKIANVVGHDTGSHQNFAGMSADALRNFIATSGAHITHQGPPPFGSYFFGITGFHGFHVFSGVVINIIMLIKTKLNHFHQRGHYEMIEKAGLYWHFVDLVWVFVFLCFYLI